MCFCSTLSYRLPFIWGEQNEESMQTLGTAVHAGLKLNAWLPHCRTLSGVSMRTEKSRAVFFHPQQPVRETLRRLNCVFLVLAF